MDDSQTYCMLCPRKRTKIRGTGTSFPPGFSSEMEETSISFPPSHKHCCDPPVSHFVRTAQQDKYCRSNGSCSYIAANRRRIKLIEKRCAIARILGQYAQGSIHKHAKHPPGNCNGNASLPFPYLFSLTIPLKPFRVVAELRRRLGNVGMQFKLKAVCQSYTVFWVGLTNGFP